MFIYGLVVVLAAFAASGVTVFLEWLLVYRTEDYVNASEHIDDMNKELEKHKQKQKEAGLLVKSKQKIDKRIESLEKDIKDKSQQLSMSKMKSMFALGFIMFGFLGALSALFDGRVVAQLPFEPLSLITSVTHRNIPGDNYREVSYLLLYFLASFSFRTNIMKFFGINPKETNFFDIQPEKQ